MSLRKKRLMVCGKLRCDQAIEMIVRGMTLWDRQGHKLGYVAAVIEEAGQVIQVLSNSPQESHLYRCIPVELIKAITAEGICLQLEQVDYKNLTLHQPQI